jgi:mRNA-degrading endonuclease RelE of RelBE toxin-antitoxin system
VPGHRRAAIVKAMEQVARDPFAPDNNITALQGVRHGYRRRFGNWRVLYTVNTATDVLEVFNVGPRGGVYR